MHLYMHAVYIHINRCTNTRTYTHIYVNYLSCYSVIKSLNTVNYINFFFDIKVYLKVFYPARHMNK